MLKDPHREAARVLTVTFSFTVCTDENATKPLPISNEKFAQTYPVIARHFFGLELENEVRL